MVYKTTDNDIWSADKGDWVSSKYFEKDELMKQIKRRNLIYMAALMTYILLSAIVLFL